MKPAPLPDLSRTAAALTRYDRLADAYDRDFDRLGAKETQDRLAVLVAAAEEVGRYYGLDTADRNSPATCAEVVRPGPRVAAVGQKPSYVREMVARWQEQQKDGSRTIAKPLKRIG